MSLSSIKSLTFFKRQPKVSRADWEKLAGPAKSHLQNYKIRIVKAKMSFAASGYNLDAQQLSRACCVAVQTFHGMDDIKTLDKHLELNGALLALFNDIDARAEFAYSTPGQPAASQYLSCVKDAENALRVLEKRRVTRN